MSRGLQMILIRGTSAEVQLRDLAAYARRPENWYRPEGDSTVPGHRPEFVRVFRCRDPFGGEHAFRVVYTISVLNGRPFRHASISMDDREQEPTVLAMFTICKFLGFTGGWEDWNSAMHMTEPGVCVVAQELPQ